MRPPEPVDSVIEKVLSGMDLLTQTRRYQIFYYWPKIMGDISDHAKPRRIDGDVLYVATSSSTWAQELTMMKRDIIKKIESTLGGKYINDIYFSEHLWGTTETENSLSAQNGALERDFYYKEYKAFKSKNVSRVKKELAQLQASEVLQNDPRLSLTFQKFTVTMNIRQEYLLQQGYKKCPVCGYLYNPKKVCPHCRNAREYENHQRILSILKHHPEISDDGLSKATGIADRLQFERARGEFDSKLQDMVTNGVFKAISGSLSKEEKDQLRDSVQDLLELRTGKTVQNLTEGEIKEAIGKRLFQLIKRAGVNINNH